MKKKEVILHLKDILKECEGRKEMGQIEHNVFEIAEHLKIDLKELKMCIVCNEKPGTSETGDGDLYCDECREKAELG